MKVCTQYCESIEYNHSCVVFGQAGTLSLLNIVKPFVTVMRGQKRLAFSVEVKFNSPVEAVMLDVSIMLDVSLCISQIINGGII